MSPWTAIIYFGSGVLFGALLVLFMALVAAKTMGFDD